MDRSPLLRVGLNAKHIISRPATYNWQQGRAKFAMRTSRQFVRVASTAAEKTRNYAVTNQFLAATQQSQFTEPSHI